MDKFYNLVIYFTICLLILIIMYFKFMNRNIFEFFTEHTLVGFPAGMCKVCPRNSYVNEDNTGCIECESGQKVKDDNTTCEPCPAGTAGTDGTCDQQCNNGEQQNDSRTACVKCPDGTAGTGGTCRRCDNGSMPDGSRTSCISCPYGKAGTGGTCRRCGWREYQYESGQESCISCETNQIANEDRTWCVSCHYGIHTDQKRCYDGPECKNWKIKIDNKDDDLARKQIPIKYRTQC